MRGRDLIDLGAGEALLRRGVHSGEHDAAGGARTDWPDSSDEARKGSLQRALRAPDPVACAVVEPQAAVGGAIAKLRAMR